MTHDEEIIAQICQKSAMDIDESEYQAHGWLASRDRIVSIIRENIEELSADATNSTHISGVIVEKPKVNGHTDGTFFVKFLLLTHEVTTDRITNTPRTISTTIEIHAHGDQAEFARSKLAREDAVTIDGLLRSKPYTSDDGSNHTKHTIKAQKIKLKRS